MDSKARLALLLATSLLFVLGGLVIAIGGDWRPGLGGVGFFGAGGVMFAFQWRELARSEGDARLLSLPRGVPLAESAARRAFYLAIVLVVGASSMLFGDARNPTMWWAGSAMTVLGALMGLRMLVVPAPARLMFSPVGIHFLGGEAPCVLHFDNLARLNCVERGGHLVVLLEPIDLAALVLTVPEGLREGAAKQFRRSLGFVGAPLAIWPGKFGLEAHSLMKTLARFVREPATRGELADLAASGI